jgi:hypothetical protein
LAGRLGLAIRPDARGDESLAILCGAELACLTGIFIAIPVVAILTVAFQNYRAHWTIAV